MSVCLSSLLLPLNEDEASIKRKSRGREGKIGWLVDGKMDDGTTLGRKEEEGRRRKGETENESRRENKKLEKNM